MEPEDRSLFPFLQPEVPRHRAVVFVHFSVTPLPVEILALRNANPRNDCRHGNLSPLSPVVGVVDDGVSCVMDRRVAQRGLDAVAPSLDAIDLGSMASDDSGAGILAAWPGARKFRDVKRHRFEIPDNAHIVTATDDGFLVGALMMAWTVRRMHNATVVVYDLGIDRTRPAFHKLTQLATIVQPPELHTA